MSGHEFEKQVRQTLNDLKLTPSSRVWENIEDNLHERKRRPALIYWLPLLLVGLSAGGYFLFRGEGKTDALIVADSQRNAPVTAQSPASGTAVQPTTKTPATDEQSSESFSEVTPQNQTPSQNSTRSISPAPQAQQPNKAPFTTIKRGTRPTSTKQAESFFEENTLSTSQTQANTSPEQKVLTAPQRQADKNALNFKKPTLSTHKFSSTVEINDSKNSYTPVTLNVSAKEKLSPTKKSRKWSFGVSAFAGISSVNEGKLLGFNNAEVSDVSAVPAFAPQQPAYKPSSISPGLAYALGAYAQRPLSKKLSLSVGLNYLQINTRNKVGYLVNNRTIVNTGPLGFTSVSNYFTIDRDNTREYRNRYHFIEVPVELFTKLGSVKKLPIQLNTGVAVSRLLRSNSLHFDGTTGVYYRNDKLLNQTQLAAKAGLYVSVLNNSKRPITLGPSVRYNISKILEKDVSARKSFMSIGLDARMKLR